MAPLPTMCNEAEGRQEDERSGGLTPQQGKFKEKKKKEWKGRSCESELIHVSALVAWRLGVLRYFSWIQIYARAQIC